MSTLRSDAARGPHRGSSSDAAPGDISPIAGALWGVLAILFFSLTLPVTRLVVRTVDPGLVTYARAAIGGVAAAALLVVRGVPRPSRADLVRLAIVSAGIVFGFPYLSAIALRNATVAHAAVIAGLTPMATTTIAVIRGRERPSGVFWGAAIVGVLAIVVFAYVNGGDGEDISFAYLTLGILAAAYGYAEGGELAKKLGAVAVICWALVLALPITVIASIVAALRSAPIPTSAIYGILYLGLFSMFLGFIALYHGMALGSTARVGQIQLIQPFLTLLWAALFMHELVPTTAWFTAVIVIACVAVVVRARVRQRGEKSVRPRCLRIS